MTQPTWPCGTPKSTDNAFSWFTGRSHFAGDPQFRTPNAGAFGSKSAKPETVLEDRFASAYLRAGRVE